MVNEVFDKNLLKHQKDLSGVINKYCMIGGFLGVGFYALMKLTGLMEEIQWINLLYFSIPVLFNTTLMGISNAILRRQEDTIYVNVYKYIIILVACINYFAISMFVPYRDAWGVIILIYFISAYYLDFKLALFGILLSSAICIFTFYFNTAVEPLSMSLANLLIRIQVISFGSFSAFVSALLGKRLLSNSCITEENLNVMLNNIKEVNAQVKRTVSLLGESSEHIADLSSQQYSGAESTTNSVEEILHENVNTSKNVQECINLMSTLTDDTVIMKSQTADAISNSIQLKQTAVIGTNTIETAVQKIIGIKESAIKTYDSAREMDERTKMIQAIVGDIQGISEETNLLSLNASIEAAKAGEFGAGFTVVAEAIRKLSDQSQKSLININAVISNMNTHENTVNDLVEKVDDGVEVIRKLNEYYNNIISDIERTISSLDTINSLADKQESNVDSVNSFIRKVKDLSDVVSENMTETSGITKQTFASCEELLKSAKSLDIMSRELNALISEGNIA